MFSVDHFIWLAICIALIVVLTILSVKKRFSFKVATYIMVGICIVSETIKIFSHMFPMSRWAEDFGAIIDNKVDGFEGAMYLLPKSLPFHLCSILIFFFFFLALSKDQKKIEAVKSFVVPVSLVAGTLALVLATSLPSKSEISLFDSFKDPQLGPYQYFIFHAGIVWYALYLVITKQVEFGLKPFIRNSILLFALFIFSIWINSMLLIYDVNFMFTAAPPAKGLPLLNLDHGWYVYIIHFIAIGVIIMLAFQLPAIIREFKAKQSQKKGATA